MKIDSVFISVWRGILKSTLYWTRNEVKALTLIFHYGLTQKIPFYISFAVGRNLYVFYTTFSTGFKAIQGLSRFDIYLMDLHKVFLYLSAWFTCTYICLYVNNLLKASNYILHRKLKSMIVIVQQ